ncbi:MAG: hypothetical protein J5I98_26085 [Phaeodactylibacter sp.]|nr:hypothetical protein [Phaeodactylibacter sp.]
MTKVSARPLASSLWRSYESTLGRIRGLSRLRQAVGLPPELDIGERQWQAIESRLRAAEERLLEGFRGAARIHFRDALMDVGAARRLQHHFGETEVTLTQAYGFFDTYLDVLTQRHMPGLGPLLRGCDALALDAIRRPHPALALVEPPLVSVNRGFGASVAREGVRLPGDNLNPLALIEIPYARLQEKCNLTSILHEAGHEAMVRLGLKTTLPEMICAALSRQRASKELQQYFALWMSEIGPDFWTFLCSGIAAAGGIREILTLPPAMMYRISPADPHPPAWLRVLLNFEWCRQAWGDGLWDGWEREWLTFYPPGLAPPDTRRLLQEGRRFLPAVARALLHARFRTLGGKPLAALFDLAALAPARLDRRRPVGRVDLRGLRPAAHLAAFRLMKEKKHLPPPALDRLMSAWLQRISLIE